MLRIHFLTLTDRKKKQGDFVRMDNLLRRLSDRRPIHVVGLPGYHEEGAKRFGKYPYFLLKEVARVLLALRALFLPRDEILYTWDWLLARNLALLSGFRKVRLVMEVNGLHSFESEIRGYFRRDGFWNRNYIARGERLVCRRADLIVTVSEGFRQTLHRQYSIPLEKIVVAPNGADLERFPFSPRPWNGNESFVVGWAGTFQPYEGFETFIDLARIFRDRGEQVRFLVVGEGAAREAHQARITSEGLTEFFDFRGKIDWSDVPKVLAEAHCCILAPSLSDAGRAYREAIGMTQMKFYEYLALGKPVVTCRLGDAAQLIDQNNAGVTCEPTIEAFAETLLALRAGDLVEMGQAARRLVEERFTWDRTAEAVDRALTERFS